MIVRAENITIESLLIKGQFFIPDYQREYDWSEDELSELLEDIVEMAPNGRHFIGHMVFEGAFNGSQFNVIDGQQRITTITILLCVIRDLFYEKNSDSLGDATHNKFIFNRDKNGKEYGILMNEMPYPVLQFRVQSKDKDNSKKPNRSGEFRILEAYNKFYKEFNRYDVTQLSDLRDKVFNLEVIFVAVEESGDENAVDAHEIFMTLNATGKDLTPLDLIKGRVFKLYPKSPIIKEPNDTWTEIIDNTRGKKADVKTQSKRSLKFLNNFFSYRYAKVSDKKIYKKFVSEVVKKNENIEHFLKNLHDDSIRFRKITSPLESEWPDSDFKLYTSIHAITQVFGIEVANPMLISALRAYEDKLISKAYFYKVLSAIERFHFINNAVVSGRSSGLDLKYSKYARQLLNAKSKNAKHLVIDNFTTSLLKNLPDKNQFIASFDSKLHFSTKESQQRRLVVYALKKIEFKSNPNSNLVGISLEHLSPEKPRPSAVKVKPDLVKNIGNLVLLDASLNSDSRIGNNSYERKRPIIKSESYIVSTGEVVKNNSSWGEKEISKRRLKLIDLLYEGVWR